jgi:hypothetical protein
MPVSWVFKLCVFAGSFELLHPLPGEETLHETFGRRLAFASASGFHIFHIFHIFHPTETG